MNIRLFVAASIVAVLAAPRVAAACKCMPPPPPQEAMAGSAAVFEGTVTDVRKPQSGDEPSQMSVEVELRVGRRFKGAEADTVTVFTAESSAACGYGFEPGGTYLVYAGETDGQLSTNLCSRTARIEDASADLAALGGDTPPEPDPGSEPQPPPTVEPGKRGCGGCTTGAGSGGAAGLLLALAVALTLRRWA